MLKNRKWILFFFGFYFPICCFSLDVKLSTEPLVDEQSLSKRIVLHLLLEDYRYALQQALQAVEIYPNSQILRETLIKALAANEDERGLLDSWREYNRLFPESMKRKDLLEEISWAILRKGVKSSALVPRLYSAIGVALTRDAYAVPIMMKMLRSSNSFLRSVVLDLLPLLCDRDLQKEAVYLLHNESVWDVRLAAIKAVGRMQTLEARKHLEWMISNEETSVEESLLATEAILNMTESIQISEIERFAKDKRANMRSLACELISFLGVKEEVEKYSYLLWDSHPNVRMAALKMLGLLNIHESRQIIKDIPSDFDPFVEVTRAWLFMISGEACAEAIFLNLFSHEREEIRILASSALASTGRYGLSLASKVFIKSHDRYVRANLALGLIGQDVMVNEACEALFSLLKEEGRLMWKNYGNSLFRVIEREDMRQFERGMMTPALVDQVTRLEILQILSVMRFPKVIDAVKSFLRKREREITSFASEVLLYEGDESIYQYFRDLLEDEDGDVRVQAALALAFLAKDRSVLFVLQEVYEEKAGYDLKVKILEALAYIGGEESLEFLVEKLNEPFQTLRIIAATALIRSLNH